MSHESNSRSVVGPLVTVIVPVRNGADTIELVLRGLVEQSYANLQILISDNASTDATPEICLRMQARDRRIEYHRHAAPLPALKNFCYWIPRALGKYVMFAAHDDLRDRDAVRSLVTQAEQRSSTVCVMPTVWSFSRYGTTPFHVENPTPVSMAEYPTAGKSLAQRLRYIIHNGFPVYGLIRSEVVKLYHWKDVDYGPELPLCVWLATVGEIEVCQAARFYYWLPEAAKTAHGRAMQNSLKRLGKFPELRLAWLAAESAQQAYAMRRRRIPRALAFSILYYWRRWPPLWHGLWRRTPIGLRSAWREFKSRRGWKLN